MGVIIESHSDCTSPIVLVNKYKDGVKSGVRLCTDFRKLNTITYKDSYPMPFIEEQLENLKSKNFFSNLDITAGYHTFKMHPNSQHLTAFTTPEGCFEFQRLPFGLCNAGATFQRAMVNLFTDLKFASVYIDDISVASYTFQEHLTDLDKSLTRLTTAGLKIKPSKCTFGFTKMKFLGFIVSGKGMEVCPSRNDTIKNYPRPKCVKHIRQFLGLASYYRKFIKGFAELAAPLNKLLKKGPKFDWNASCENSFKTLIYQLQHPPILIFPDTTKPYRLLTDASDFGLGAVLARIDENGDERVISYASRSLTTAEKNYNTTEKELCAIIWAIDKYRPYLFAGPPFELITDHQALT